MTNLTKENVVLFLDNISFFAYENLKQIESLEINFSNEFENYYLGLINRQYVLTKDLSVLFKNKKTQYLSSQLILFRCITDDFIRLNYIINQSNSEELIIKLTADAIDKNFKKIKELADLNETKLEGKYPFYPTYDFFEELKKNFKNNETKQIYLKDIENFKFKNFDNTGSIIRGLSDENYSHKLRRAYFTWRYLSDFVHYSNFSFGLERDMKKFEDSTYKTFAEIIGYSFNIISSSFLFFEEKYKLKIIDSKNLTEYYKSTEH